MTPEQRKELREFRDTLPEDLRDHLDRMLEREGEERVHAQLGLLRSQADYLRDL
jgi:hypothetical protein